MTRDEIIKLALEAGVEFYPSPTNDVRVCVLANLERFAELVASAEREACAELCDQRTSLYWMEFDKTACDADRAAAIASEECADAIRARGQA